MLTSRRDETFSACSCSLRPPPFVRRAKGMACRWSLRRVSRAPGRGWLPRTRTPSISKTMAAVFFSVSRPVSKAMGGPPAVCPTGLLEEVDGSIALSSLSRKSRELLVLLESKNLAVSLFSRRRKQDGDELYTRKVKEPEEVSVSDELRMEKAASWVG